MKLHVLPWLAASCVLTACSAPAPQEGTMQPADSSATRDLCFRQVTTAPAVITGTDTMPGTTDSLLVHLHIDGERVTGELAWLPGEKDRMTGSLEGTLQGARIIAIYSYTAEGMTAKEEKIMRLDAQGLHLKSGELVEREGIWTLKDTAAAYTAMVPAVPCP